MKFAELKLMEEHPGLPGEVLPERCSYASCASHAKIKGLCNMHHKHRLRMKALGRTLKDPVPTTGPVRKGGKHAY